MIGTGGHHRHEFGVDHRGLVHHDDSAAVPIYAGIIEREQLAMDGAGMAEAVALHVLGDGVGRRQSDHPVAARLVNLADRGHRIALAGAGLTVDQREAFGLGGVANGAGLLARDGAEPLAAKNRARDRDPAKYLGGAGARGAVRSGASRARPLQGRARVKCLNTSFRPQPGFPAQRFPPPSRPSYGQ